MNPTVIRLGGYQQPASIHNRAAALCVREKTRKARRPGAGRTPLGGTPASNQSVYSKAMMRMLSVKALFGIGVWRR